MGAFFAAVAAAALATTIGAAACAPSAKEVKLAKTSAYDTSFDEVWTGVIGALATDYPYASVIDKAHHRIVTCWRPIEKPPMEISGSPGAGWQLYRVIVDISMEAPWRISVSGRAGSYHPPQIVPIKYGDAEEPGWVNGRTDRVNIGIYNRLKGKALPDQPAAPKIDDPEDAVNIDEACVIRSAEYSIPARKAGLVLESDDGNRTAPGEQGLPGNR